MNHSESQRVLILRSNPVAPDPRVEKIAAVLNAGGYSARVLGWDRFGQSPIRAEQQGVFIERLPIVAGFGKGIKNIGPLLRWQFALLIWLIKHRSDYDIVHACDFDTILPALLSKFVFGKKVVYDIFDFYSDHLRATPQWLKKIIRAVDLWAIDRADAVVLVDESRKQQIEGSTPIHLEFIYNSPEDVAHCPSCENATHADKSLNIVYVGLLQIERGIIEVLDVIERNPEWTLDIAGFGGDERLIHERASKLPNVFWHGRIDYERAIELSKKADVLFATYDPAIPNHRYSSPNKVFEAMMLGKPIIVSAGTNMDTIILAADCGLVVPYGEVDALEDSFRKLYRDIHFRKCLGENARRAYDLKYSWKIMSERLLRLYDHT